MIDLSAEQDSTNTDHRQTFRLGTRGVDGIATDILADGGADGRWYAGDDDARLKGTFKNAIPWEFVDRSANAKPIYPPPGGTQVGEA